MPIPEIERILADCRDRALMPIGGLQSLAQAKDLYGDAGNDFLSAWRNTLVFRGLMDKDTLELLSLLSGTFMKQKQGWNETRNPQTRMWEWTNTVSQDEHARLTPEQIRLGHPSMPDGALMIRREKLHEWVRAVKYFNDPWIRVLLNSAEHARNDGIDGVPLPPLAKDGNYSNLSQLGLDERFRALQQGKRPIEGLCTRTSEVLVAGRQVRATGIPATTGLLCRTRTLTTQGFLDELPARSSTTRSPSSCSHGCPAITGSKSVSLAFGSGL